MPGHECYHCKQWVEEGEAHDCWTTTEAALTNGLSEDLQEAYARLREAAVDLGEQRIYASHNSIMFARRTCYFFVRPKRSFLEVCVFLGRTVKAPQVSKTMATSKVKVAHMLRVVHRDQVEPPVTDWLREAYDLQDAVALPGSEGVRRATAQRASKRPQTRAKSKPQRSSTAAKPKRVAKSRKAKRRAGAK